MYPVKLAGPAMMLRELAPEDADALHRVYDDPDATRHQSFEPRSAAQISDIIAAAAAEPHTVYMLAVADAETGS
jgi:ribosomal-protein-alanine N-acetyltransferase